MYISVIIPALDEVEHIERAIASAERAGADEVLVVDGGSRDGTRERVLASGARLIETPPGRGHQLRIGVQAARGDVLLMLHADNWLDPAALAEARSALADERVGCAAYRQRIEARGGCYRCLEWGNAFRARWLGLPYGDQGILVRRERLEAAGGIPDVPLMEDVLLMRRLRRTCRFVLLAGPLHVSARRWQRRGVVRQTLQNWLLLALLLGGCSPQRLAQFYGRCP